MNKYAYFGNDENSAVFLDKLDREFFPDIIITGEPRRSGRGRKLRESPPARFAKEHSIPLIEISCSSHRDVIEDLRDLHLSYFLVFSYGCMIPEDILSIPTRMSVNIHPSLLPHLRGAAPINRSIMNGDSKTGVSFFKMVKKMDAGPLIIQEEIDIEDGTTSEELRNILIDKAVSMFISFDWSKDFSLKEQEENCITFAQKIRKDELFFDMNEDARHAANRINGLAESGVRLRIDGKMLKLRKAVFMENEQENKDICLTVKNKKLLLKCKKGIVRILQIQSEGKKTVSSEEFINGNQLKDGDTICAEYSE